MKAVAESVTGSVAKTLGHDPVVLVKAYPSSGTVEVIFSFTGDWYVGHSTGSDPQGVSALAKATAAKIFGASSAKTVVVYDSNKHLMGIFKRSDVSPQ